MEKSLGGLAIAPVAPEEGLCHSTQKSSLACWAHMKANWDTQLTAGSFCQVCEATWNIHLRKFP